MGTAIRDIYKYAAFISYAHTDEGVARRLHNALETYPLPKGMDVGKRAQMTPIFRDVTELTAHHSLSEKIRDAVETSRFLIVLCSPAAKASHWVNEEIRLFRSLHGEGAILAVIVDGAPDTAFPPALLEDGREPLAADISGREGFKFGTTQLAASMLGVGLDQLVQRDQKRRRVRTQALAGVTTAIALVMGGLAWNAIDARDDAEVSQAKAEVSRSEAEKMVEFMIKDLKEDLEPIGKLNILNGVGKRVGEYYDAIPLSDMDDDRLGRRSRARHLLGQVALDQRQYNQAETELLAAYDATKEIMRRKPLDTDAIYNHAQSEYWVGSIFLKTKKPEEAKPYRHAYAVLSEKLYNIDPNNLEWVFEYGWAQNNLGHLNNRLKLYDASETYYERAIQIFDQELTRNPNSKDIRFEISAIQRNLAGTQFKNNKIDLAKKNYALQVKNLDQLSNLEPDNKLYLNARVLAKLKLQHIIVTYDQMCSKTEMVQLTEQIENIVAHDPSNYERVHDYIFFPYFYFKECNAVFDSSWRAAHLTSILKYASPFEHRDEETQKKVFWLAKLQAKND